MSKIEWVQNTDGTAGKTWNPVIGCRHVSPGCDGCYAARLAAGRLAHLPAYAGLAVRPEVGAPARYTGEVRLQPDKLEEPLRWRKPQQVFVCSMSDLFNASVPTGFVGRVWDVMAEACQHTFKVLTKRPHRMARVVPQVYAERRLAVPLPNVWVGTSVESGEYAHRLDHVRATPAAVRWLSIEPLIGPLDGLDLTGIDWVVIGGESGPPRQARPMAEEWVDQAVALARAAGAAVFVKQMGSHHVWTRFGRHGAGGDMENDGWRTRHRIREYPTTGRTV